MGGRGRASGAGAHTTAVVLALVLLGTAVLVVAGAPSTPAAAQGQVTTYVVTTDADPEEAWCAEGDARPCSFRQALRQAGQTAGHVEVRFEAPMTVIPTQDDGGVRRAFEVPVAPPDGLGTDIRIIAHPAGTRLVAPAPTGPGDLRTGTLLDVRRVTFAGVGARQADDARVRIEGLELQGPSSLPDPPVAGGIVHAVGVPLELHDVTIVGGSARSGGAVAVEATSLHVERTSISGAAATSSGGAIWARAADVDVTRSALVDNSAGRGGAIEASQGSELVVHAATLTGNRSWRAADPQDASAIHLVQSGAVLSWSSLVGPGDQALVSGSGSTVEGRGLLLSGGACTLPVVVTDGVADQGAGACIAPGSSGQEVVRDLGLAARSGSGHEVAHVPLPTSPAVDRVIPTEVPIPGTRRTRLVCDADDERDPVDQRGVVRPVDGTGDGRARCDVGAVEAPTPAPAPGPTDPPPADLPEIDLRVEAALDRAEPARLDERRTLTVVVARADRDRSAPPVDIALDLAIPGFERRSGDPGPGTCPAGLPPRCTVRLQPGAAATYALDLIAVEAGRHVLRAEVSTDDPGVRVVRRADDVVEQIVEVLGGRGDHDRVVRIGGEERIATAVLASRSRFPDASADVVVVARADVHADALSATPLALAGGGPVLLTGGQELAGIVLEEVRRVIAPGGRVLLIGGELALDPQVASALRDAGLAVERVEGVNRFATAARAGEVLADLQGRPSREALLADGTGFADAVVAGPAAARVAGDRVVPLLLTDGSRMPEETRAVLEAGRLDAIVVGGRAAGAWPAAREVVAGPDRIATSIAVAERWFGEPATVAMATGHDFADALAAGAVIGTHPDGPGPVLLTDRDLLRDDLAGYLTQRRVVRVLLFGGEAAIGEAVRTAVLQAAQG